MDGNIVITAVVLLEQQWSSAPERGKRELLQALLKRLEVYRTLARGVQSTRDAFCPVEGVLSLVSRLIARDQETVAHSDEITVLLLRLIAAASGWNGALDSAKGDAVDTVGCPRLRAEAAEAIVAGGRRMEGVVAHLMAFVTDVAASDKSVPIRILAPRTLQALVDASDGPLVASFLPGTVSKLSRLLASSKKLNRQIVEEAIRALRSTICRALHLPEEKISKRNTFAELVADRSIAIPAGIDKDSVEGIVQDGPARSANPESMPDSFRVVRTVQWHSETTARLSSVLAMMIRNKEGPLHHSAEVVQACFAECLADVILFFPKRQGDELHDRVYAICASLVRGPATSEPRLLFQSGYGVEDGVKFVVHRFRNVKDDSERLFAAKAMHGYFVLAEAKQLVPIVLILQAQNEELVERLMDSNLGSELQAFADESTAYFVAASCRIMGYHGCLTALLPSMLRRLGEENESSIATGACFAAIHLILGACGRWREESGSDPEIPEQLQKHVSEFLDHAVELAFRPSDDNEVASLTTCMILDSFSRISRAVGKQATRKVILLQILVPTLRLGTASRDSETRAVARAALETVCAVVNYDSLVDMYRHHLNFIVDRVTGSRSVGADSHVLRELVESVGDDALALLADSIKYTADNLPALSEDLAVESLDRMHAMLSAAVPAPAPSVGPRPPRLQHDVINAVREKLRIFKADDPPSQTEHSSDVSPKDDKEAEADGENIDDERNPLDVVAERTLMTVADLLGGRNRHVRARALRTALPACQILQHSDALLLPRVAVLMPLLPQQLDLSAELDVVDAATELLTFFCRNCGDFIARRLSTEIWPKLCVLLKSRRSRRYADVRAATMAIAVLQATSEFVVRALVPIGPEVYPVIRDISADPSCDRAMIRSCHEVLQGLVVADPDLTWGLMAVTANRHSTWRPHSSLQQFQI